jgi:hypothetical protein
MYYWLFLELKLCLSGWVIMRSKYRDIEIVFVIDCYLRTFTSLHYDNHMVFTKKGRKVID